MARALVQSINIPSSVAVAGERDGQFNGSRKNQTSVRMICDVKFPSLKLKSFVGLRGCNVLDAKSGETLHSKVAAATFVNQPRGCRIVPKAMSDEQRNTKKAVKVIMLAQEEARRLGHNLIGTEQILLGLIGEGTGTAAKVLKSMGINLRDARIEVEKITGKGSGFVAVEIPFTRHAKRVLELSREEARQLGHNYVDSEHLLLGLLRGGKGVAACVLENLGADPPNNIYKQVLRMVGKSNVAVGASVGGGTPGPNIFFLILKKIIRVLILM
ncbi:ATP-dependent Clp protease ATP-binding subunit ClpA homolog CD4A, chloroplastic-like [Solanum stenotomum]|uniref:ATP-dependent Clp protease ATP-binding subunit ClpA homolog CD4A, chloroplastic-like n=1 Tax=Solanum stenotomum TaxID=172797 RepID=UPI0020D0CD10|nr:ATP-dependent Clp protease ATP-binding subunit ClpA homolog CD4A, chloroplastic-like [Solanum stenotomum]